MLNDHKTDMNVFGVEISVGSIVPLMQEDRGIGTLVERSGGWTEGGGNEEISKKTFGKREHLKRGLGQI
jgi:hypothetical protein